MRQAPSSDVAFTPAVKAIQQKHRSRLPHTYGSPRGLPYVRSEKKIAELETKLEAALNSMLGGQSTGLYCPLKGLVVGFRLVGIGACEAGESSVRDVAFAEIAREHRGTR